MALLEVGKYWTFPVLSTCTPNVGLIAAILSSAELTKLRRLGRFAWQHGSRAALVGLRNLSNSDHKTRRVNSSTLNPLANKLIIRRDRCLGWSLATAYITRGLVVSLERHQEDAGC